MTCCFSCRFDDGGRCSPFLLSTCSTLVFVLVGIVYAFVCVVFWCLGWLPAGLLDSVVASRLVLIVVVCVDSTLLSMMVGASICQSLIVVPIVGLCWLVVMSFGCYWCLGRRGGRVRWWLTCLPVFCLVAGWLV